jgi:hypothetical protein
VIFFAKYPEMPDLIVAETGFLHQHSEKPCNSEQKSQQAYF